MSYEPTNWKDGDLVTSAKLNKIEQGIAAGGGSGVPIIHAISSNGLLPVLDKTWQEIYDAGCGIIAIEESQNDKLATTITRMYYNDSNSMYIIYTTLNMTFITDDPNSYPHLQFNDNSGGTIAV